MDAASSYRQLLPLGREAFIASTAPAALVRMTAGDAGPDPDEFGGTTRTVDEAPPVRGVPVLDGAVAVFPIVKKAGAPYPDRITIGRTPNNDLVIEHASVSRLHAYVRRDGDRWLVADAGSKNGSALDAAPLEPRREHLLRSGAMLRLGDVELAFYVAGDLFAALGGTA